MKRAMSEPRGNIESVGEVAADEAVIEDLLVRTSRTFALAIPLLPQPTRREVTLAYLLFRIADTFEDASVLWRRQQRMAALDSFCDLLRQPSEELARNLTPAWLDPAPSEHDGYVDLIAETTRVVRSFLRLSEPAREAIARHTIRTSERMATFVERSDEKGNLRLSDLQDLRDYCYAVAGIVGEMLCDLFILGCESLEPVRPYLSERAAAFGEGLQLVNILKDSASDATEGRFYLPVGVSRSDVFDLARADLRRAAEYTIKVQQHSGPDGVIAFTALPVELARATLDRVESGGAGTKLTRPEVIEIHDRVHRAIAEGRPALPL